MLERLFFSRRRFLRDGSFAAAGIGMAMKTPVLHKEGLLDVSSVTPFVDPLPIPPVLKPEGTRANPENATELLPFYRVPIRETRVKLHRDLPPTQMWSFGGSFPGPTIETQSGKGVLVEWANELPAHHFLPIDHTIHGAECDVPEVRAVVHLHGGRTPPASDGYPEDWTTPGKSQSCHYPCAQHAALLFYHDHTMGINRLNTYAGMQGFFIIRDPREDSLHLPSGPFEVPLMITDRLLTKDGQLYYPVSDDPKSPWVPEVFGDALLVNGKLLPWHAVEPRKYRLRLMNGSNGRFYRFSFSNKAEFQVIANDQGLLPSPAVARRLPLAPAERADIVVDFSSMAGQSVELVSDTLQVMQFRVAKQGSAESFRVTAVLHEDQSGLMEASASRTRRLTLVERMNDVQQSMGMYLNNTPWHAPITEKPVLNTTEIWELVNLTEDSHPIHLHLVRFKILDRRPFDDFEYQSKGTLRHTGPAQPPAAFEAGWKDTVRVDPATVTRILVPFQGYAGRYVWHCHVLEHEDNEMMRPFEVLAPE